VSFFPGRLGRKSEYANQTRADTETFQSAWQSHLFKAFAKVKTIAESQALQGAWQGNSFKALVEVRSKC
jgi:hypothetical protein